MIELDQTTDDVIQVTIFEDKCSDDACAIFKNQVLPAFHSRHQNLRSAELIATAASLIKLSGMADQDAIQAARSVIDLTKRRYRASLAVTSVDDTVHGRKSIFDGYDEIDNLSQNQRIGATFVVNTDLRAWFDALAAQSVTFLKTL